MIDFFHMSRTYLPNNALICLLFAASCAGPSKAKMARDLPPANTSDIVTFQGRVTHHNKPAAGAYLVLTSLSSGSTVNAISDLNGTFQVDIKKGEYALTATTQHAALWIENQPISEHPIALELNTACHATTGRIVADSIRELDIVFESHDVDSGKIFITRPQSDAGFSLCLPKGVYSVSLLGSSISIPERIDIPINSAVTITGHAAKVVQSAPNRAEQADHSYESLFADIEKRDPTIIGLGEATHGSAEFTKLRADLVIDLAKRLGLRTILLENDAIATLELDRYVNGEAIDIRKAISGLGFWTTDTYEFLDFIERVRTYNLQQSNDSARLHIWGIDAQDTSPPVSVLLSQAAALNLSPADEDLLRRLAIDRARFVRDLDPVRRGHLGSFLSRLAVLTRDLHLGLPSELAIKSLIIQVGYMDGDVRSLYSSRRDTGMAEIASYIVRRLSARACLWAHNSHVGRHHIDVPSTGHRLSVGFPNKYYAIGFFLLQGTTRAWDETGELGVLPHRLPRAPSFTVESTLMAASQASDIAWIPLSVLPSSLRTWLEIPRFVRSVGAAYPGPERSLMLLETLKSFDAAIVIRTVTPSSPTSTGIRNAVK